MRDALLASNLDRKNAVLLTIKLLCHKASQQNKYRNSNITIKNNMGPLCPVINNSRNMCLL